MEFSLKELKVMAYDIIAAVQHLDRQKYQHSKNLDVINAEIEKKLAEAPPQAAVVQSESAPEQVATPVEPEAEPHPDSIIAAPTEPQNG